MNVEESREIFLRYMEDWLEYKKTKKYYYRMKRRAIKGKEIIERLKRKCSNKHQ